MITYLGGVSIGACLPGVGAALQVSLQDLEARITALLAFNPGAINLAADLQIALGIVSNLQAAINFGLTPPSIALQVELMLSLLGALKLQLQILLQLQNLMLTAGVDAYSYDGPVNQLGPELTTELVAGLPSGGTGLTHANAIVLVTSLSATWTAMQQVFIT